MNRPIQRLLLTTLAYVAVVACGTERESLRTDYVEGESKDEGGDSRAMIQIVRPRRGNSAQDLFADCTGLKAQEIGKDKAFTKAKAEEICAELDRIAFYTGPRSGSER